MTQAFSGVGRIQLYTRVNNFPGIGTHLGNCPKYELRTAPQSQEKKSSMDPARFPLRRLVSATEATISLACDEFNVRNLAQFWQARADDVAADAVTTINKTFPTGVVVGDVLGVDESNITDQVITDSTGSPKTLTKDVNYTADEFSGEITIIDLTAGGPYVQPLKSAHKQGAVTVIAGLAMPQVDLWIRLAGTNTDGGARVTQNTYRARLDTMQVFQLINEGFQDMEITGAALADTTKQANAVGGQIYSLALPADHE